jgi:hypothetical protein
VFYIEVEILQVVLGERSSIEIKRFGSKSRRKKDGLFLLGWLNNYN